MAFQLNRNFQKREGFRINFRDAFLFMALGVVVWAMNTAAQMFFPSQNLLPYCVRTVVSAAGTMLLFFGSIRLLQKNSTAADALGLKPSKTSLFNFIFGVMIGLVVIIILGIILYLFVPYYFIDGPLKISEVFRKSNSFFWMNFTEELLFRGYPLLILSQRFGWRTAVCVMAIPFGLFHLPGLGFSIEGLKMIVTTATYSFVFSFAYILTGTLWTAIGVHVVSNILLHLITGLDGMVNAVLTPVFKTRWPGSYDPGLLSFETSALIMALTIYLLIVKYHTMKKPKNSAL